MQIYDAGVDYITQTFKPGHRDYVRALTTFRAEMSLSAGAGESIAPETWRGYTGEKIRGLFYGEREDGLIIRASGSEARIIAKKLADAGVDGKTTRIDFQVTAKRGPAQDDYFSRVQQEIARGTDGQCRAARVNQAVYKNRGTDCGCTIGSRSSARYFRIYDKSLEQRGRVAPGLVRFEGEYKGKRALQGWAMYKSAAQPYYLSVSLMKAEFTAFGIDMSWLAPVEEVEFPSSYEPSSLDRKLSWLATHVRSSVRALQDAGREAEVLEALGLAR